MVSPMCNTVIVFSVGTVVVVLASILGWIVVPSVITSQAVLKPENSAIYDVWIVPPVPITIKFFLFDCKNCLPNQLRNTTFKPDLDQIGPFVFREARQKFNITENGGRLTYRENIVYHYEGDDELLNKTMTTVNPVYFILAALISDSDLPQSTKTTYSLAMHRLLDANGETPFLTVTAQELLISGYSLKNYVNVINSLPAGLIPADVLDRFNVTLPIDVDSVDPKFGLMPMINDTDSGNFTIESGANGLDKLGLITAWNGESQLHYWNDTYCNMINGTDGAIYPPMIDTSRDIYLFDSGLSRSILATYDGRDVDVFGVKGNRFSVPEYVFGNYTTNPDNFCYCYKHDVNNCHGAGILDLRSALSGLPILLSTPHFYLGDQKYIDAVVGIEPNRSVHETFFDLEPNTAVPLNAAKRIQMNIDVRRYDVPTLQLNLPDIVFPFLWLEESAAVDEKSANDISGLLSLVKGINIGRWCFLAAGIVLVMASAIMLGVYSRRKGNETV